MSEGITRTAASWPVGPQENSLRLPDGRGVAAIPTAELTRVLVGLGVPGCSAAHGRPENVAAYERHLASIGEKAHRAAVDNWLAENSGSR